MHTINEDRIYSSWDVMHDGKSFLFWAIFALWPLNNPKNQNFEKMRKTPGGTYHHLSVPKIMIICYTVPEIRHVTDVSVTFHLGYFCPFTTLAARKIKIKKKKKCLEISSFYTSAPKIMIICYTVPEIWCVTDVIRTFHFGLFLFH